MHGMIKPWRRTTAFRLDSSQCPSCARLQLWVKCIVPTQPIRSSSECFDSLLHGTAISTKRIGVSVLQKPITGMLTYVDSVTAVYDIFASPATANAQRKGALTRTGELIQLAIDGNTSPQLKALNSHTGVRKPGRFQEFPDGERPSKTQAYVQAKKKYCLTFYFSLYV